MEGKKKKLLTTGLAVALAALLLIGGGTFAYLQSESKDVVNKFKTNEVQVELTETGNGQYNIIPGTTETKDPTVTVDNSVDAYVYVKVTDKTEGLVTYDIAEGWTKLDGYDDVYYREVDANTTDNVFSVLKNDEVTYSAALENSDMLDEEGNLKDGIALTFKAFAIQQKGFENDPKAAWLKIPVSVPVEDGSDFTEAVQSSDVNEVIQLTENISIETALPLSESGTTNIDLNGKTLTANSETSAKVETGDSLTLENGTVIFKGGIVNDSSIGVAKNASVTLKNVNVTDDGAVIFPAGNAAEVNIIESEITSNGSYCVATNAAKVDNYNVEINLIDSTFNGPTPVLINVPGKLNMNHCTVNAKMQGVVVRGGTAVIENCNIANTSNDNWAAGYFDNKNWGTGNTLPLAGITIGNKSTAYQYPSNVTLTNTTVTSVLYPVIYTYGNTTEENGVTLTYDGKINGNDVIYGGGYVTINGSVQQ